MTLSPLTDNRPDTHSCGHLVAGDAQARRGPLDRPAVAPQMLPELQSVPSTNLRANTIAASAPIQTSHASRRAQIPIACTAPSAHDRSRFRALALFGRRPIERVAAIVFTGIQKPAQSTDGDTPWIAQITAKPVTDLPIEA
jgi:hypothetical protein